MHYIQKHILDELRVHTSVRSAKLNADRVENGHFRYHLEQLLKAGYVQQLMRGVYSLTPKGLSHVDKLSVGKVNLTQMPKVITYTLLKDGGTVLLHRKSKQPYMGLLNMVGGKLHEGELAEHAAIREVYEKTGATIDSVTLRGVFEVLIHSTETLLTHAIAYVFVAKVDRTTFTSQDISAISITELQTTPDLAPDFMPIFTRIMASPDAVVDKLEISIEQSDGLLVE